MKHKLFPVLLFLVYGFVLGLGYYLHSLQIEILSAVYLCAAAFGLLFFLLETRTGLTLRQKTLPLLFLLVILAWSQAIAVQSTLSLYVAVITTLVFLANCREKTSGADASSP